MLRHIHEIEQQHINKANTNGTVLVLGSKVYETSGDRRVLYPNALGVDMLDGEGVDLVADLADRVSFVLRLAETMAEKPVTHVDCHSVLEHCEQPWKAAENIQVVMEEGATILLSVPFVWRIHAYPNDYWRFSKEGIRALFPRIEWESLDYVVAGEKMKRLKHTTIENTPYFARTEVLGFGRMVKPCVF